MLLFHFTFVVQIHFHKIKRALKGLTSSCCAHHLRHICLICNPTASSTPHFPFLHKAHFNRAIVCKNALSWYYSRGLVKWGWDRRRMKIQIQIQMGFIASKSLTKQYKSRFPFLLGGGGTGEEPMSIIWVAGPEMLKLRLPNFIICTNANNYFCISC